MTIYESYCCARFRALGTQARRAGLCFKKFPCGEGAVCTCGCDIELSVCKRGLRGAACSKCPVGWNARMSASSGRALQVEVCLASERDALHLHGIWTVECVSVIVVKDDPAVFQGSYFGETWMSFRGDWILLSRQWGHPDGVWSIIRIEFRINTFQSYGHRPL